jgi:hypothetical protein
LRQGPWQGIAIIIGLFVATRNPFVGNFLAQEVLEVGGIRGYRKERVLIWSSTGPIWKSVAKKNQVSN